VSQHFKVHELLDRKELDELEAFAREPARTVDECHEWLQVRGYTLSRTAVFRWLHSFRTEDRFRTSAEMTNSIIETAKREGVVALNDANVLSLSVKLQEKLLQLASDDATPAKELLAVSMALKNVVATKTEIEEQKSRFDEAAKKLLGKKREISQSDIDEVRKAVFG
jgi:hypothetical protein